MNINENEEKFLEILRDKCYKEFFISRLCTEEFEDTIYGKAYNALSKENLFK